MLQFIKESSGSDFFTVNAHRGETNIAKISASENSSKSSFCYIKEKPIVFFIYFII